MIPAESAVVAALFEAEIVRSPPDVRYTELTPIRRAYIVLAEALALKASIFRLFPALITLPLANISMPGPSTVVDVTEPANVTLAEATT